VRNYPVGFATFQLLLLLSNDFAVIPEMIAKIVSLAGKIDNTMEFDKEI
jgi:hypothetical protein